MRIAALFSSISFKARRDHYDNLNSFVTQARIHQAIPVTISLDHLTCLCYVKV